MMTEIESERKTNENQVTTAIATLRKLIDKQEEELLKQIRDVEATEQKPIEEYKKKLQGEQQGLIEQIFNVVAVCKDKQPKKLLDAKRSFENYIQRMDSRLLELKPLTRIRYHISGTDIIEEVKTRIQTIKLEKKLKHENSTLEQRIANNSDKSKLNLTDMQLKDIDMEIVANELTINHVSNQYFLLLFRLFAIPQKAFLRQYFHINIVV